MESVRYRILGPLEALGEEGPLSLGSPKQRGLLAVLLLHRGEQVTVSTLIEDLWGERAPRTAEHSIQTYASGLRNVLGAEAVVKTPRGYRLADGAHIDATQFEALEAAARAAEDGGDVARAFELAGSALGLWRGPPLVDVELATSAHPIAVRLSELRLQTAERRATAALVLGRPEEVIADLQRLTGEHPLRESLWAMRMRALAAAGRTAEALRVFQDLRKMLGNEMGIEPSPELVDLEEALLLGQTDFPTPPAAANPYKGLRPFGEADAADFFGRQPLVRQLIETVIDPGRAMASVVGPSGSGKSSVVSAGLIPALRSGIVDGSASWTYVTIRPTARPIEELTAAVWSVTDRRHDTLERIVASHDSNDRLVLFLDQMEGLFIHAEEHLVAEFLDLLVDLAANPAVSLIATMRADFYGQPLLHSRFGPIFTSGVVNVHPLTADELVAAAVKPAERTGVSLEPALVSELIRDVASRPGSLPLFQYALTEVYDRRREDALTLDAYRASGGVRGALLRRTEEVYEGLTASEQDAMRQVFFRLVSVTEGEQPLTRRVDRAELGSLGIAAGDLERVVDRLGSHRLISHDRNPATGEPTIEVAHEALLAEWPRLREWLNAARVDLRRRGSLTAAREEWEREERDPGFLLTGARLVQYETWAPNSDVALTTKEWDFLHQSIAQREEELAVEQEEQARHGKALRRARSVRWAVRLGGAAVLALSLWMAFAPNAGTIAVISDPGGDRGVLDLFQQGVTRAEQRHDLEVTRITPLIDTAQDVRDACEAGTGLVIVGIPLLGSPIDPSAPECRDTMIAATDLPVSQLLPPAPNLVQIVYQAEEGAFLAGAAAAMVTQSKVVGLVGGIADLVKPFLAGFEAGVTHVDPQVEVLAVWTDDFGDVLLGRAAGDQLVDEGADVIFHAAGVTGVGTLAAVTAANQHRDQPVWFIGVDVDEAVTAAPVSRPYILTSVIKRIDNGVADTIDTFVDGELEPGVYHYGLAEGGIELAATGGHLDPFMSRLEELRAEIAAGAISVDPSDVSRSRAIPLSALTPSHHGRLRFVDGECTYDGPTDLVAGDALRVTVTGEAEAFVVLMKEGTVFSRDRLTTAEPSPEMDPVNGSVDFPSLLLPAREGVWWVACFTEEWLYPAAAIEVTAAP